MRVAIIDTELAGLDFAIRCADANHEVLLFQQTAHPIGKGFPGVKRTDDFVAAMKWAGRDGLVVPTGNAKFLTALDRWRDMGSKVFGPTAQSAALEIDRGKGMAAMKASGIDLVPYQTFDSLEAAETYARKSDKAMVFKPLGSEDDKSLTFVGRDPAEMVGFIQRQIARGAKTTQCMLQDKIDLIADFGVSGWFGPEGFLPNKYQECFEHKKLCNGEIGPNTGEMGTVCQYTEESKLFDQMLAPMGNILATLGHRGDFAIGVGIDSAGKCWPLEFTCRLGWPCFYIQCASHKGDPVQWMMDLMNGEDTLKVDYRPAIGVVLAQPPWPKFDGKPELVEGVPISGMEEVWDQVHPAMMMIGKGPNMESGKVKDGPQYQTAGEMVAIVTGLGATVDKARKSAYSAVDEVRFSDMIYRTDIGQKVERCLPTLHRAGYCLELEYE